MTHLFRSTSIAARCNRVRNHSPQLAHRRLSRLTPWLAVLLLAFAVPEVSWGQTLTNVGGSTDGSPCYESPFTCCTEFTYTPAPGTTYPLTLTIHLYGPVDPTSTSCFDWDCWGGQSNLNETFSRVAGTNDISVTFASSAGAPWTFWLCGDPTCMADYQIFGGVWHDTKNPVWQSITLNSCGEGDGWFCLPCDYTQVWVDDQTGDADICVTRGSVCTTPSYDFTVCFSPSLPALCFPFDASVVKANTYDNTCWGTPIIHRDGSGNITCIEFIGNPSCMGLLPCETFCFGLGHSHCGETHFTETVTSLTYAACGTKPNYSCPGESWTFRAAPQADIKADGTTLKNNGGQNYPNPLEASTGFKTMVPFETSTSGVAKITIVDQTGKKVFTETMNATYAGTHFFYVTGDKLPTGTYYYTVEFPKGVVIVSKTMLIVK
jgi:hypothetical protein